MSNARNLADEIKDVNNVIVETLQQGFKKVNTMDDAIREMGEIAAEIRESYQQKWDDLAAMLSFDASNFAAVPMHSEVELQAELTLDELEKALDMVRPVIYYVADECLPFASPPAPGEPDEPSIYVFKSGQYQYILCHPDHVPDLEEKLGAAYRLRPWRFAERL